MYKGTHLANGNGYKFFEGSHIRSHYTQTYTVSYHTQDDTHGTQSTTTTEHNGPNGKA